MTLFFCNIKKGATLLPESQEGWMDTPQASGFSLDFDSLQAQPSPSHLHILQPSSSTTLLTLGSFPTPQSTAQKCSRPKSMYVSNNFLNLLSVINVKVILHSVSDMRRTQLDFHYWWRALEKWCVWEINIISTYIFCFYCRWTNNATILMIQKLHLLGLLLQAILAMPLIKGRRLWSHLSKPLASLRTAGSGVGIRCYS